MSNQSVDPRQVPAKAPTWKRRLLTTLTITQAGLAGCVMLILGIVLLLMVWGLCMAIFFFGQAAGAMP